MCGIMPYACDRRAGGAGRSKVLAVAAGSARTCEGPGGGGSFLRAMSAACEGATLYPKIRGRVRLFGSFRLKAERESRTPNDKRRAFGQRSAIFFKTNAVTIYLSIRYEKIVRRVRRSVRRERSEKTLSQSPNAVRRFFAPPNAQKAASKPREQPCTFAGPKKNRPSKAGFWNLNEPRSKLGVVIVQRLIVRVRVFEGRSPVRDLLASFSSQTEFPSPQRFDQFFVG